MAQLTVLPEPTGSGSTFPGPGPRPGFGAVVRAEWVKLSSVRSTGWTLFATVLVGVGFTAIAALDGSAGNVTDDPDQFVTLGMAVAQICAVVLGALIVTTEYGTGMIRTSFAAVPARLRVLSAKALLATGLMAVVGVLTAFAAYAVAVPIFGRADLDVPLDADLLGALVGSAVALAAITLFTVGLGFVLRHLAGTLAVGLALILILPMTIGLVPGEIGEWLTKLMPGNTLRSIASPGPTAPDVLEPMTGLAVFAAETAVVLAVGCVLLRRRDA